MRQLEYYKNTLGPRQGKEAAEIFALEYKQAAAAQAGGEAFSGNPACRALSAPTKKEARSGVRPLYSGRLVLLTDSACFSSCLMVADLFRQLGALHVGQATDANTNYMEVRDDRLPSGLGMFSTLQAVAPGSPKQIGPFQPHIVYNGDIADTVRMELWVAGGLLTNSAVR